MCFSLDTRIYEPKKKMATDFSKKAEDPVRVLRFVLDWLYFTVAVFCTKRMMMEANSALVALAVGARFVLPPEA